MAVFSRLGAAEVMALSFSKGHVQSLLVKTACERSGLAIMHLA